MTTDEIRRGIESAIRHNRAPLVIKTCERPGCTNEIQQRTYGKGRKYCSKACRYAKNKKSTTNFC